jgi:cytochrome c2
MLKKSLLMMVVLLLLAACQSSPEAHHPIPAPTSARVNPAPVRSGDPARGQALFSTLQPDASVTCSTCHHTDTEEALVGPGLLNVSERAENRIANRAAAQYLYDSITNPGAFVVDGYPNIMPTNWGSVFSDDELDDLIAYLMTLH